MNIHTTALIDRDVTLIIVYVNSNLKVSKSKLNEHVYMTSSWKVALYFGSSVYIGRKGIMNFRT